MIQIKIYLNKLIYQMFIIFSDFMIGLDELKEKIEDLTKDYKAFKFEYIDTSTIVVEPWTRLKCQFGCPNYGKTLVCPPYTPKAEEFLGMVNSYEKAILFEISLASIEDDIGGITKISVDIENLCAHFGYTLKDNGLPWWLRW